MAEDIRQFTRGPLNNIGKNLNDTLAENRESLRTIIDNVEDITHGIKGLTQGSAADVTQILGDIKAITASVRGVVADDSYGTSIKDSIAKLSGAVDKLDRTLGNAEDASKDVKGLTQGLQDGEGTIGRLLKDEKLINDVEEVVSDAGSLIKDIVGLQTIVGLRSEYNFLAGSIKTYLSVELHPRPDKYYLIELINDPRGQRNVSTTLTRSDDPSRPLLTREDKVVVSDAFRVSFQFAKRISFATFRFGIKESTGGIGADFNFWNDRIQVTTDIFDFQANTFPRLKALASWQFFRSLYIVGGVDDAFNDRPPRRHRRRARRLFRCPA